MKKGILIISLLLNVCLIFLGYSVFKHNPIPENILLNYKIIHVASSASDGDTLKMSDITDFEWDKLLVYGPYSHIEDEIRKDFKRFEGSISRVDVTEGYLLLLFMKSDEIVSFVNLPYRYIGMSFSEIDPDTVLQVKKQGNGTLDDWEIWITTLYSND